MAVKNPRKQKDVDMVEPEVVDTETNDGQTPVEPEIEQAPAKVEQKVVVKNYYCLLVNDRVQKLGKSYSPQGDWYYVLLDLSVPEMRGPFPLLVTTGGKLQTVSGFVQLSILSDLVYSDVRRLGLKGLEREPATPIDLKNTKMMSVPIRVEF